MTLAAMCVTTDSDTHNHDEAVIGDSCGIVSPQIVTHIIVMKPYSVSLSALCVTTDSDINNHEEKTVGASCCIASVTTDSDTRNRDEKTVHHHQHYLFCKHEGRWGTTDDFATSFLHFSLFSTAL